MAESKRETMVSTSTSLDATATASENSTMEGAVNVNVNVNVDPWEATINEAIKIRTDIPQTNSFTGDEVFVRSCYPIYYDKLKEILQTNRMVSLTGTPGIGKSVFYLYYFDRYRQENPTKKVLTASFSADQEMEECVLYPALNDELIKGEQPVKYDKIPSNACDLYLYDGPPNHKPPGLSKMIAFTSPHAGWLDKIASKYGNHFTLFMPNWDADEQRIANDVLGLNLTNEMLEQRRALFGGTARYILTKKTAWAQTGARLLSTALGNIKSLDGIRDIFNGEADLQKVTHRILHYEVDVNNLLTGDYPPLKPASPYIAEKMEAKLLQRLTDDRDKLQHMLENAGKASAFAGWVQENVVHETLLEGGDFSLRSLGSQADMELKIIKTDGKYKRFKIQADVTDLLKDVYKLPDSSILESVDSYYYDGTTLWLFQITSNMDHGVKLMGLLHLVEYLKLTNRVQADPSMVKLVFVTPSNVAAKFKHQKIVTERIFEHSGADVSRMDCDQISGIGPNKKRKLEEKGIRTVGDLLKARAEDITLVKSTIEAFRKNLILMQNAALWSGVEQLVHGIDSQPLAKLN